MLISMGILYKADPDPDLDLEKKHSRTLEKVDPKPNLLYELKLSFWQICGFVGADFKYGNTFLHF